MISDIDYFLRDLNRGIARIQQGEIPDGSGTPIGTGGTLTDYWFKPGISDPFIAFMSTGPGAGGIISSTVDPTKGFINLGNTEYVDEAQNFVGINVSAPAAPLHLQPASSGVLSLTPSSLVNSNWDGNRTGAGGAGAGAFSAASVNVNDDDTLYCGVDPGVLGNNTQQFGMSGTILANRVWTVTIRLRTLSSTATTTGDMEFNIIDEDGNQFTKSGLSGSLIGLSTTWTTYTFTLDCTGAPTGTSTANSIIVGLDCNLSAGVSLYTCCTYIELSAGGDSDLMRWNDSGEALLGKINSDGKFGIGTDGDVLSAFLTVEAAAASDVVSIFKGATSQTGNLTQWQNQAGTVLSFIDSSGAFNGPAVLTPVTVTDSTFTVIDNADPTKTFKFELGGSSAGVDVILATSSTTDQTITLPNGTTTLGALAVAGTWTALQTFRDTTFKLVDDGDATKTAVFSLGGASANADLTLAWAGTADRTVTLPNATGTIPTIENSATISGAWTFDVFNGGNDLNVVTNPGGVGVGLGAFTIQDVVSGFKSEIAPVAAGLSADRTILFPDGNGEIVLAIATQTLNSKTLSTSGNVLRTNTSSSGVAFADNSTTSKVLRFILSGLTASTNSTITCVGTAARTWTTQDYTSSFVAVGNTTSAAGVLGTVNLTAQTGNIGATTLLTSSANSSGLFRVTFFVKTTTVGNAGDQVKVTVAFNDGSAQTADVLLTNLVATPGAPAIQHNLNTPANLASHGSVDVYSAASNAITFTTTGTYAGSPQYTLRARIEALG